MDFAKVLARLVLFLDRQSVRYGIAGAFALHAHGISRATGDLDLVVEESAQPALFSFLDGLGYQQLYASAGFSNHLHPDPAWGRLDFIYADAHTADLLFSRASKVELFAGTSILAPRPEHLAAMKVLAMKNDPTRAFRELADLQLLLALPGVDQEEIRGYFAKQGFTERFNELERNIAGARI